VVVEVVGMVVVGLGKSSCNGAKRLVVVVGLVELVALEVLEVLAYLAYRDLPCFLVYLVVQPVLVLPGYRVARSFRVVPVGRALEEEVVEVVGMEVVEERVVRVLLLHHLESQRSMAKLSFPRNRRLRLHRLHIRRLLRRNCNYMETVYWSYGSRI